MGRFVRLEMVAGLGIALALPALALPAGKSLATVTTLAAEARDGNGRTEATLTIAVTGQDGQPATGSVAIEDDGKPIAGAALNADGRATPVLSLAPGDHNLTAVYVGDTTHAASVSQVAAVPAATGAAADFSISVAPGTLSLQQGQSGQVIVSITPSNAVSLTSPMFVTLSCAGLPDQATCTFTPQNLEILPTATAPLTSSMVIATVGGWTSGAVVPPVNHSSRIAWAILLPGAFGLAGLAFGVRRRPWLCRLSLLSLVALITTLGATGCSPLYNYRNHGPTANLPTPAGSFTLQVTAQSSNGVTATTHSTTMGLTVTQ